MKKRKKLIWQLLLPYLLITVLALAGLTIYASIALRHFLLDRQRSELETRLVLMKKPIRTLLAADRRQELDSYCKTTGRATATRITIILPKGDVAGDSARNPAKMTNLRSRPEVVEALTGRVATRIRRSETLNRQTMYVAAPLTDGDGRRIAIVRAAVPLTFVSDALSRLQWQIALGGFLVALLAGGVSMAVSRRISEPIATLQMGARRFEAGDLSHRLPVSAGKEVAALADTFNRMAEEMATRIDTITRQRNELRAILASLQEGLITVDRKERIRNANQAAADMLEVAVDALPGKTVVEITRNLDFEVFVRGALAAGPGERPHLEFRTGGGRMLKAQATVFSGENAGLSGILIVLNDVTELRRLEAVRQDFVANVSHEIRTPLTAIKGFVETLRYSPAESETETQRFLDIIDRHVNRMNAIVGDLLTLSRLEHENGTAAGHFEKKPVRKILETAHEVCRPAADKKQIVLSLSCADDLTARMDDTLMEQALINLIDNAVKYSPADTTVTLTAVAGNDELRIQVQDQGPGIARKHLPRLFERFYRIDSARSRQLGGTGLGLAIVKHIVQVHGGHISVQSLSGHGSTFTLYLPFNTVDSPSHST